MADLHPRVRQHLERGGVTYRVLIHAAFSIPIRNPKDFAAALGWSVERIAKTLLLKAQDKQPPWYCLITIPASKRVDFKAIETILQSGHLQIAPAADLEAVLGYPSYGVSPLGAEGLPVVVDESLMQYETIAVGGGETGVEVEISPVHLVQLCVARVGRIS